MDHRTVIREGEREKILIEGYSPHTVEWITGHSSEREKILIEGYSPHTVERITGHSSGSYEKRRMAHTDQSGFTTHG